MKLTSLTKSKPIIAVDIDDVLADWSGSLVEFANHNWQSNLTRDKVSENWGDMFQIDSDEWSRRFNEFMKIANPYEKMTDIGSELARKTLMKLKEGFGLVILTSRPLEVRKITDDWLGEHFPGIFAEVIFALPYQSGEDPNAWEKRTKADLAVKIGAEFLIDDQPKHTNSFARIGGKSLLFGDYGWNRNAKLVNGVTRVANWGGVADYFGV